MERRHEGGPCVPLTAQGEKRRLGRHGRLRLQPLQAELRLLPRGGEHRADTEAQGAFPEERIFGLTFGISAL